MCRKRGRTTAASVVDHIKRHEGCQVLFWDRKNWQSLCKRCHDRKTGRGG
ncbi:MAG: HNH endonuclease signature motif containing protein [Planctomycetota bacterium]